MTMEMKLDDEVHALILSSSLPNSLETLVASLSKSTPNGVLTTKMVKESMLNEEKKRKEQRITV